MRLSRILVGWGGNSVSKKELAAIRLRENRGKGKFVENFVRGRYAILGKASERTGRGSDFKVTEFNPLTGKKEIWYEEVKSGNAKESPLQKKTRRKKGKKYVLTRISGDLIW